ncbi:MAG: terpene utilization protein AtuA, partial [Pseudomonadota bacterium]
GFAGGRPKPSPVVRLFSFTVPKAKLAVSVHLNDETLSLDEAYGEAFEPGTIERPATPTADVPADTVAVPLIKLAWARSGDKGNKANIGIIARRTEYLPFIWQALTEQAVGGRLAHFIADVNEHSVERFLLPGSNSINFLIHDVLGGGGVASIRNDPQAKGYSQLLLACPVPLPATLAEELA